MSATAAAAVLLAPFEVPVEPDQPEGQEWVIQELSKPQYQAARPTLFDEIVRSILDWLGSIRLGGLEGPPALGLLIALVLIVAAVAIGILVFGLPRLNRRSQVAGALFGDDDARSAAQLREDAARAAARGDWPTAIAELFRSVARNLAERELLTTFPGTTAQEFGRRAGGMFPGQAEALRAAAATFDQVRYLGGAGSREDYERLLALERALRTAGPADTEPVVGVPA